MNILIVPDSFKGTMSTFEVCDIISSAILKKHPGAVIRSIPVADGGEGSADCLIAACGGRRVNVTVSGPFFEKVDSYYGLLPDGTAVTELAACSGLSMAGERRSAADTTSYGLGELIGAAVRGGSRRVIIALGGSSSNDGGCGMAASAGVRFRGKDGTFVPVGRTLEKITGIDMSAVPEEIRNTVFVTMCDVVNPLYGENGAAYVFAPQKGVKPGETEMLDRGLVHLSGMIKRDVGIDISGIPGSGAAGGCGGGTVAFLGAHLQSGIDTVLDAAGFDTLLDSCDLVITGEGKLDGQSMGGKAVIGIARRAAVKHVPVIAVVGCTGEGYSDAYRYGVKKIIVTDRGNKTYEDVLKNARSDLEAAAEKLGGMLSDDFCSRLAEAEPDDFS